MAQEIRSFLSRLLLKRGGPLVPRDDSEKTASGSSTAVVDTARAGAMESSPTAKEARDYVVASSIDDIIRVEEISDAEFFIGDLFRRRFHGDPPN